MPAVAAREAKRATQLPLVESRRMTEPSTLDVNVPTFSSGAKVLRALPLVAMAGVLGAAVVVKPAVASLEGITLLFTQLVLGVASVAVWFPKRH